MHSMFGTVFAFETDVPSADWDTLESVNGRVAEVVFVGCCV